MPHYHFDLVDWKGVADQGVADRSNDIEAMDSADAMARRLLGARPDLRKRYCAILVTKSSAYRSISSIELACACEEKTDGKFRSGNR